MTRYIGHNSKLFIIGADGKEEEIREFVESDFSSLEDRILLFFDESQDLKPRAFEDMYAATGRIYRHEPEFHPGGPISRKIFETLDLGSSDYRETASRPVVLGQRSGYLPRPADPAKKAARKRQRAARRKNR